MVVVIVIIMVLVIWFLAASINFEQNKAIATSKFWIHIPGRVLHVLNQSWGAGLRCSSNLTSDINNNKVKEERWQEQPMSLISRHGWIHFILLLHNFTTDILYTQVNTKHSILMQSQLSTSTDIGAKNVSSTFSEVCWMSVASCPELKICCQLSVGCQLSVASCLLEWWHLTHFRLPQV